MTTGLLSASNAPTYTSSSWPAVRSSTFSTLLRSDTSATTSWVPKSAATSSSMTYVRPMRSRSSDQMTLPSIDQSLTWTRDPSRSRDSTTVTRLCEEFGRRERTAVSTKGAATLAAKVLPRRLASRSARSAASARATRTAPNATMRKATSVHSPKRVMASRTIDGGRPCVPPDPCEPGALATPGRCDEAEPARVHDGLELGVCVQLAQQDLDGIGSVRQPAQDVGLARRQARDGSPVAVGAGPHDGAQQAGVDGEAFPG